MPRRQRSNFSRRAALSSNAQAWLRGDPSCGFFKFKTQGELEALWQDYGDHENMWWRSRYHLPVTRDYLEERESAWLNSGESDEYGAHSCFIDKHYTDEEKQALWTEHGDQKRFRWVPGMRRPEAN